VQHGHILLNGRITDAPSALVKEGDTISWREGSKKTEYFKQLVEDIEGKTVLNWLSLDRQDMTGQIISMPTPEEVDAKFDGKAIVEYYSR
jgi:small subunit ribosomal protein S4